LIDFIDCSIPSLGRGARGTAMAGRGLSTIKITKFDYGIK